MARKVITQVSDGLGNQLFMYASGRALAWRNNADLIAETGILERDLAYHREWLLGCFRGPRHMPRVNYHRGAARWWSRAELELTRLLPPKWRWTHIERRPRHFMPEVCASRHVRIRMVGYWQSERYFDDCREKLLADLQFDFQPASETGRVAAEIMKEDDPVAVHLRSYRDIADPTKRCSLPWEYTIEACARIRTLVPRARLFLFADVPEYFRDLAGQLGAHTWIAHNQARGNAGAVDDLYLMACCRHFVIANSSMSWWGAWLSQRRWGVSDGKPLEDRLIMAPGAGLFNADFVPSWWTTLSA